MRDRTWMKRIIVVLTVLMGLTAVGAYAAVWLEFKLMYPSEQTFCKATSPDGERVAAFSVKYEGERAWLPLHPQPHFYVTVTDGNSGEVLLRETDFAWSPGERPSVAGESLRRLRERYAPAACRTPAGCSLTWATAVSGTAARN